MRSTGSTDVFGDILQACSSATHFTDAIIHEGFPIIVQSPAGNHPMPGRQANTVSHSDLLAMAEQVYAAHALVSGKEQNINIQKILDKGALKVALDVENGDAQAPRTTRLRFTIVRARGGRELAAVVRRIPQTIPELQSLKMPNGAMSLTKGAGLVLLTGPTKQGKSTTAASMLQHIRDVRGGHIVTIEDPIEYTLHSRIHIGEDADGHSCPVTSREVGTDVASYHEGVEDALRMNPTTIMIGEIRESATAQAALNMGESGHLVISTMQSTTAEGAVHKLSALLAGCPGARLSIASTLRGVIRTCLAPSRDRTQFVPAYEFFLNKGKFAQHLETPGEIRKLLNEGELAAFGKSLKKSLEEHAAAGLISPETARSLSNDAGYDDSI